MRLILEEVKQMYVDSEMENHIRKHPDFYATCLNALKKQTNPTENDIRFIKLIQKALRSRKLKEILKDE